MTIRELIDELNQLGEEYLDYGILLVTEAGLDSDFGDNEWLQSLHLHTKGSSGYENDGCLEFDSDLIVYGKER